MCQPFIDANVLLRAILQDHPDHSARARRLLERIAAEQESGRVTTVVFFEVAFVLDRSARLPKERVFEILDLLLAFEGLRFDDRRVLQRTVALARTHNVPIADAHQAAAMEAAGVSTILSFDRHFDRFPGIERVEP